MDVKVTRTDIPDLLVISHQVFEDERGFFMEVFRKDLFEEQGLPTNFVQCNHSRSSRGVIRGLHFQWEPPMGKMMRVIHGTAFLVAVDIRKNSPTLGKWWGEEISAKNKKQIWAPAGFARGFCVLSDFAEIQYFCTGVYNPSAESGILWNDPEIGVQWPAVENPNLSVKDKEAQTLSEWLQTETSEHFQYKP
ncbi:MAG: dTDP-4-dehydrorhamnose 3,5-epimerase [SAR324 cluster bacterium]|nr:dTDP-4-dehydrorhamnose 3,5-epimerase [SAR324 cluster bacterium]